MTDLTWSEAVDPMKRSSDRIHCLLIDVKIMLYDVTELKCAGEACEIRIYE